MRKISIAAAVAVAVAAGAAPLVARLGASASTTRPGPAGVEPSKVVRHVTNRLFPLPVGRTLVYRGVSDGESQVDRVHVTKRTKLILGVKTTVVKDVVSSGGEVLEKTFDWYAQDKKGNVWYFGEATAEYENGKVTSREGSWKAGVDGARPGLIMEADPHAPDGYRQEYYKGHAEDQAWVLQRGGSVKTPLGLLRHRLLTLEWTRLEPEIFGKKMYARGYGLVREASATGPRETLSLVAVHNR